MVTIQETNGRLTISEPLIITPRLLPGAPIGGGYLSIAYSDRPGDGGRTRYRYAIDAGPDYRPEGHTSPLEYAADDLQSGAGGGSLYEGLCALVSFLIAAGEAYEYSVRNRTVEPSSFPTWVEVWAYKHTDELCILAIELEDNPDAIREGL